MFGDSFAQGGQVLASFIGPAGIVTTAAGDLAIAGGSRLRFPSAPPGGTIDRSADREDQEGREQSEGVTRTAKKTDGQYKRTTF
jgi:hypothetical protein